MRVALINEGIYPYRASAVGTWCHGLVRGLPEHEFHVVALIDSVAERLCPPATPMAQQPGMVPGTGWRDETPTRGLPLAAVPAGRLTTLRVDGSPPDFRSDGTTVRDRHETTQAAILLCRGMLDEHPRSPAMFRAALHRIARCAPPDTDPLAGIGLPAILLDAWAASRAAPRPLPGPTGSGNDPRGRGNDPRGRGNDPTGRKNDVPPLPRPTMTVARAMAALLGIAVRPLTATLPTVDLCHSVNCGLSTMVALAAKWRKGVPYVLTEHSPYLSDPLLRRARTEPALRALMLRFLRALTHLGYAEAAAIVPPSERMRRWALENGAPRELITMIPPGVDPSENPALRQEPAEPVIAWIGPDREREPVLAAFATVRREVPQARLIVIGHPQEGTRPEGVSYTGPVAGRRTLYGTAQVVTVSGYDAAMPYPLIEAMMCGRPTVCTESGGIAEMAGIGASVVPPGDAQELARAWVNLLTDVRLRRELSNSARQRSRTLFSLRAMVDGYQLVYARAGGISQPRDELVLSG